MHIYNGRFPSVPGTALRPPNVSIEQYRRVQVRLGIQCSVVVMLSTYGADNRYTLDALKRLGPNVCGAAAIDTSVAQAQPVEIRAAGVRAIRFSLGYPSAATVDMLAPLASRIGVLGWHIELIVQGAELPALESRLLVPSCPLVIDHIAHVPQPDGMQSDAIRTAQCLVDKRNTWIALSGPYADSKTDAPVYADVEPATKVFIDIVSKRMLWGTDWPHPTEKTHRSDDAALVDTFATRTDRADWQQMIFVTNPVKLYDL